jgi:hypothetical protein
MSQRLALEVWGVIIISCAKERILRRCYKSFLLKNVDRTLDAKQQATWLSLERDGYFCDVLSRPWRGSIHCLKRDMFSLDQKIREIQEKNE